MEFKEFKNVMQTNFTNLIKGQEILFEVNVSKDILWDTFLNMFPEELKVEYTCNCCRSFIKNYANVVVIDKTTNKMKSIWDFDCEQPFKGVVNELNQLVINGKIENVFVTELTKLGTDTSIQLLEDKTTVKWDHLHLILPKVLVKNSNIRTTSNESIMGNYRDEKNVFKRGLDEISLDAIETTLELINQNSIYRGEEFKSAIQAFLGYKQKYDKLTTESKKDNFAWVNSIGNFVAKIRGQAIGTLLIDITEGNDDLDVSVEKFGSKMTGYKRPLNTIVSKKQIENAETKIIELGLENSLLRKHATIDDITVNNVIFVDRDVKKSLNPLSVFDELKNDVPVKANSKSFNKIEEITIEDFIKNVVPTASSIEIMLENQHVPNLLTLVAPKVSDSLTLFKWDYKDGATDSMKQRVKDAGGKVDGVLRFSIQWNDKGNNNIDFDAHCQEPDGNQIYYANCRKPSMSASTGQLDVDIITPNGQIAVENITWSNKSKMKNGKYKFFVNNYSSSISKGGFTAEIEYNGQIYSYEYPKNLKGNEDVIVAEIDFNKDSNELKFIKSLESTTSSKDIWNISTNKFIKVSTMMFSPNYWNEQQGIGNKHYFFMLADCLNPDSVRGFYNEYLKQDLLADRKVFEILGSKMKVPYSNNQLSGLGFSSTQKNEIICKVEGSFSRTLKIKF